MRYTSSMNTYLICDSTFEAGVAQLRSVTEIAPKITVLMCEQKLYLV